MTQPDPTQILTLSDAGHTPAAIALALSLPPGKVYATLRRERPGRKRAPRTRTSLIPSRVLALSAAGVKAGRIAAVCGVSAAYVYRLIKEAAPLPPAPVPPPPY